MLRRQGATHNMSIINPHPSLLQGPALLHDLVAHPSTATAIDFLENGSKRRTFSYKTLHTLSNALAQKIVKLLEKLENASPIIPVLLPQCPELYITLLAILKAGKAFCPLSLDTPGERLRFILDDISADLVITNSVQSEKLHVAPHIATLHIDEESFREEKHSLHITSHTHTNNLAYVLYTSGSTGLPKAVCVSHRAATQSLLAHDRHIPRFTRFLQFAAPTFDVSVFEIFFPWYRGCTLSGRTRARMLDNLPETIRLLDVDAAELTPTVVSNLLEGRSSVPSLGLLLTIGEMLTRDIVEEYGGSDTKESILWAMYGPTEAAIHCTLYPRLSASASTQMIGSPLDTVSAFIAAPLSQDKPPLPFSILPIGEEGELVVGGLQLAEEYLNRPELTATSFMHHSQYGYLYRTGDRAKLRSDGTLECLGRVLTGQVKLKGQRVELGEIEQTILKVDGCRAITVKIIEDDLVAFCATGSSKVSRTDVLQVCKQWLPDIMVPSDVVLMDRMPQLGSGKIDQSFLVQTYRQTLHRDGSKYTNLDTFAGNTVLGSLQNQLKRDLTPQSNLASAGLDSLQAIRLASRLRADGYQITTIQILSATTVEDILRITKDVKKANSNNHSIERGWSKHSPDIPELKAWHADIVCTIPCTPLQEAMLAETVARPNSYCNWFEIELQEQYSFDKIKAAIQHLAQCNEILRSGFFPATIKGSTFVQIIWRELDDSQVRQVSNFTRHFTLGSQEAFLQPLSVQIKTCSAKPRLLFQVHHSLYDGWSLDLIIQDLEDILRGNDPIKRLQYSEVVRYHDERETTSQSFDKEYWAAFLLDRPVIQLPNFNGQIVESTASRSVTGRSAVDLQFLIERSRELRVGPQVWFQAAITFVLSLYIGSNDMIIGNVTSGRTIPIAGIEDIVGPCIASLPFRLRFDRSTKVEGILRETQRLNLKSLEHCALPLREVVKVANIQGEARLFDVLFVWQQSLGSGSDSAKIAYVVDSADELEFPITFEFEPRSDHISFRAMFDPSIIPENQVNYLSRQVDEVVHFFLEDTNRDMSDVAACFPTDLGSIANPVPRQPLIQHGPAHAVEKWASIRPNQVALSFFHGIGGTMEVKATATYKTLNNRANRLAHVLLNQGVHQGCLVAVVMEKSIDLYVAILAVLKSGAGYLPLVPDLPEERTKTILTEAAIAVCVSDSSGPSYLQKLKSLTVLDIDKIDFAPYDDDNISTVYNGAHVAYAVYTSGSTGTPKGVLVTQDNLMSNLDYLSTVYPYTASSKLLQSCSQAFDVSVFEIFFSWHVGICLCTAKKDDLFSDLEGAINQMGITHLSLTPTVAALIDPDNVKGVEFLVTAGEAVTEHVRRKWTGRGLHQGYGPSETTNICTVRSSMSPSDLINNIGRPFDNTSAFVLDPNSNTILPRGAVGELCFGGYQVFQGYLNRPDLTAAKIISHPTYGRIYRSGDLGMLLSDDSILFSGRLDDQVKIRGQRVELGEISSTILDQQCVRDCSTLLLQLSQDLETLVTFWVPTGSTVSSFTVLESNDFRTDVLAMFAALSHRLPTYMVPSYLIAISRLPITTQGKIDKRLLQRCFVHLSDEAMELATQSYDALGGPTIPTTWEIQVAQILAETLRISSDNIKRGSSFFNLGLDSVSAISFGNQLRKANLGHFTISEILKNATIAHLAALKDTQLEHRSNLQGPVINAEQLIAPDEISRIQNFYISKDMPISKIRPCTPLQEAMLSSGQSTSGTSYSNMMVFSVDGSLSQLQESWAHMVGRHEILRTSFFETDNPSFAFAQVVLEDANLQWGYMDWSSGTHQHANKMVAGLLRENKPPVWLAISESDHSTRLFFCCHHAIYDGLAIRILLREVQEVYHHQMLPPPVSYDPYLQDMLSQNFAEADSFWTASFRDFEPTAFPDLTGKANKEPQLCASWQQRLRLPLGEVREACQNQSVTFLAVIHATWAKLLCFYTGVSDVCFGNVVSGRALPGHDLERLVAPCFNTLPVRINFDLRKKNVALAKQAHAFNIGSSAFQLTPLRRIQNIALKDSGRLFDTLVILQQPSEPLDSTIWTLEEDRGDMDMPLVCEIAQNEAEDRLDLTLHYHSTILSEKEAIVLAETFDATLGTIINQPDASASDTTGLPQSYQSEISSSIKDLESRKQYLHSGFEEHAQNHPDRTALEFLHADGARTIWTYRTLNEKANDIAHTLIENGVKPEQIVPIHISKSPTFYASILGVLKAGAAFAPVHPGLPDERRRLMLEDLNADLVLCTNDSILPSDGDGVKIIDAGAVKTSPGSDPVVNSLTNSNLAYCIFTSGSTGVPKAVSMEHCAPMQTIECSRSLVPWCDSSRLLQYAATTFDMCYYDCFLTWTLGFALCAAEQDMMLNELPKIINDLNVDLLDLTPSVAASLVRSDVPCVKWLYCIGEAMTRDIVEKWEGVCVNSYGPSETAFCTTIYPVSKDVQPSVIGAPFSSTSFAVFPESGDRPLPLLSIGELYIGGAQLARGYYNRAELTAERFVTKCGQRFYRSGDIVRMLSDRNFEFIGRADDQVKIRGLRVELGEINNTLRNSHPDVVAVATQILRKDATAKEQLVAFLVTRQPIGNDKRDEIRHVLRQAAKLRLPPYMVPQFFTFIDEIPRSLAGKVDKRALTKIFQLTADVGTLPNGTAKHSWTTLESQIRHVFVRLSSSRLEEVSSTTTIYQLGLDSISAVQVASALRKEGHRVNAADVMKYLTCLDLAAYLEQNDVSEQPATERFDFVAFDRTHRPQVIASCNVLNEHIAAVRPCTPLQRGMVSQMLAREGAIYVNYLRLELDPSLDLDVLKQAWEKVVAKYQILRTGFVHLNDKGHPFGMIEYIPEVSILPWNVVSESDPFETPEVWLERLQRLATSELYKPLWDIRIVRRNDTKYLDLGIFHALFDAQSLQSILRDVVAAYSGVDLQSPVELDPVIDGILRRSTSYSVQAKEFWARMGKQAIPYRFPNLAPLRYNPQSPKICAHQSKRSLSEIEEACRRSNTSLQAVGLASWLSLISAYTGEPTVTCGVVLSGRSFEDAEDAVFPCINTVPFAHAVIVSSRDMLNAVTSLITEVQQHQHVPLNDIQRLMGFQNEALFDTIFAYQKLPDHKDKDVLWRTTDERATIEYPVSIELEPNGDHLDYRLTVTPHSIPQEQAALILEQLDDLVQCFLFESERTEVFNPSLYSVTPAKEPTLPSEARLLHDFVELTAKNYPERIALEFAESIHKGDYSAQSWTYSDLDAEGNRVANLLTSNGVQPGDLVCVCFDKCPEASFAMLGVLKAGGAFVAIDPGAPSARQSFIVRDSGATAVLSMSAQSAGFAEDVNVPVLNLDNSRTSSLPDTKPILGREINSQDRSYCLYTSGTTGTPKGCELSHENAVQALLAFQRLFAGHWDTRSRWLQFASFHFDVSVLEQYWSWSVGICVVSAPRDVIFEDLANSINTLCITHIDLTPSLAQILHPDDVPSLCKGVFITGGESLKQEILDVWGPKGVIYNGYGPTEATIGCTMYPRVPANGKPSNIGPQFDNVGSFVLLPNSDIPVLRGGIGELCVSGKLVGKGYLNRDELTEKSFPYLDRFEERVYRTGDLVRILHDGTFEFLGRADDQVKLRGQRLEIGEINSVIRQSNKNITDVATLVLKHLRQQKEQLVAFIVQGRTKKLPEVLLHSTSEMIGARDACHESLPPYMVPTHFIPLTSLPLNINNKADVKKLKGLYETLSVTDLQKLSITSDGRRESWSSFEIKLRTVLMAELGVGEDAIGKETSFFELGMDSISVIGVVRAFKQASISGANASMIMKHSTVRRLAKVISTEGASASDHASLIEAQQAIHAMQHRHRHAVAQILSVNTSDIEALSPCTPLQHGMIAKSLESENRVYFNTFIFELSDKIDVHRLRAAWQVVHASIQILRTAFVNTEEGYVQAVLRHPTLPWKMETVSKDDSLDNDLTCLRKTWLQSNQNDFAQPLELIYITLPGKRLLLVNIFHGLYDGISVELVFKAVWDAYNGHETDTDAPSFQSVLAYGLLRTVDGARTFWQNHLSSDNTRSRFSAPSHSTSEVLKLARELRNLDKLESTRRKLNVTAQAMAQACWLSVLQELKKSTVATGVVVSGRSIDLEGADRIIGPMFNTIPYQHRRHKSESWGSIIKRVHDFNVAAHPYQHTPLRDIIKWCKTDRNQPLFDNLFVYQVAQTDDDWARNEAWQLLDGDTVADYPLAFEVEQGAHGMWKLTLVAQSHVFDERTSLELLDNFENALYHALENPETVFKTSMELNDVVETKLVEDEDATSPTGNKTDFEWTEEANKIRKLLAELTNTGLEDIHEDTSILELGLDSIDAIKLSSKLKKCGVNLPVSGIMRGLTVPKMLPYISKPKGAAVVQSTFDAEFEKRKDELRGYIERQDMNTSQIEDVLPLTPLQEAMVAEMVSSEFTRYYNFDVLELEHETNVDRLRNAWIQVVEVSPILRTSFVEIDDPTIAGSFAQVVQAQSHNFWSTTTLDDEPDFSALFEKTRRDARQSFSAEPPFQVQIFKSPNQTYLILSIAHALYDGWALSLLHADVKRAYEDNLILRPDYQPTLSEIITTSGAGAPTFWSDYLSEAKPSIFDKRNISARTPVIVHRLEQNSKLEIAAIMKFAKKSNISLQTLGQSVFAIVLASYFRSLDVTFGSVLSGRNDETTSQLLFPTMNTVAIRTILHGSRLELLRHVQDSFTNVKQWQHFPLRKALALAGTHTRLFESLFIYQKSVEGSGEDGRQLYTSVEGHSDVEYPVCVEMEVVHEQLVWRSAIKNMVFDEADSKAFLNKLDEVLRAIVESPERPVIEFASQGISLCGLSAFEEQQPVSNKARNDKVQPQVDQPQAETVHAIRQVLAIASDTPEYEITDNMTIFHIGLDSISAIKVSSLLRRRGVVLSVGEMLRAGSVDNMARIVDARSNQHAEDDQDHAFVIKEALHDLNLDGVLHNANSEGCGIKDLSEVHMLPATAGQLYMLSMWLNTRGSNFYPEFTYKITGEMTFEKLQNAWKNLVDTNSILRTYLVTTQDPRIPYVQLVRKKGEAVVSIVDITYHSQNRATQGVDLSDMKQPWTHLRIAQTQDGWVLKLKIHHALYDGVSLPIMIQQLQDICNGSTVPSPHGTIENFTAKSITPQALETRKSFWTQYLADISQHPLQQPISSVSTKTEIFKPGLLLTKPLEETARRNGLSTQALFLASYAKLYAILTHTQKHHDVVLGIYLANRSLPITGIENAPIPTVNLLPLRVHTPLEQGTIEVAQQIQQDLQKTGEHANAAVSLYEIKEWTRVTVDTFVNFLTLPTIVEEQSQEENTQDNVTIVPVSEWNEERSRIVEHTAVAGIDERVLETLRDKEVNEVYLHAVDVEVTVRHGALDVGVFAPVEMLDLVGGNRLIEDLKVELEGICK